MDKLELAPTGYTLVLAYENEMEEVVGHLLDANHRVRFMDSRSLMGAEEPEASVPFMDAMVMIEANTTGRSKMRSMVINQLRNDGPCALVLPRGKNRGVPIASYEWMMAAERAYVFHENKFHCVKNREAATKPFKDIYGL
ncbi:hypothetical protein UFOVP75_49 [uncultured Caudovirales phage]|uniref:Uncharacterized protein n=1 Tax=uncultured Caudovirales phage TaxID=2100421 RepID=A0A6J5L4X2_9CAUD|nr:hypothetical protein UFOVP75_49 [uncultured Caudovirales phage]